MGGMGRIYYRAISTYAADHDIVGSDFDRFHGFVAALDDEYVDYVNEQQKAEQEKAKAK